MEQKNLLTKEFPNKGWGLWAEKNKTFKEAARNRHYTARQSGGIESIHYGIFLVFFYFVIFIHKLDKIRKEYVICLKIFSATKSPNIIKFRPPLTK